MLTNRWSFFLIVVAAGCFNSETARQASPPVSRGQPPTLRSSGSMVSSNPFDVFAYTPAESVESEGPSSCLTARLGVETLARGELLRGALSIDNECTRSVAILTAPVETRLRLSAGDRFPAETGIDQVYAIAYLFRKGAGLGSDAFRGDGGLQVFTLPEYVVVKPAAKVSIPLTSGAPLALDSGTYGLALFTIATWADGSPASDSEIDLRNDVTHFAEVHGSGRKIVLPPAAIRLAPVAFFDVRAR